jgi:hypothetical protein
VVQPETILRWHRAGFKVFWRWKSRNGAGRPKIDRGLRDLIQRMSRENPLWGASRIHGELLMLGFEVAQSTVSKYMARPSKPPSQTWKTFLQNHTEAIAAIDMCVVPTLTFDLLFAFLVLGHGRRQLLWFQVTRHPTAEWLARQITEAFPWTSALAYLVHDAVAWHGEDGRVDLWQLGSNRLLCGDARDPANLNRLLGGELAALGDAANERLVSPMASKHGRPEIAYLPIKLEGETLAKCRDSAGLVPADLKNRVILRQVRTASTATLSSC